MAQRLPNLNYWCIIGDFNMIEEACDRVGGSDVVGRGSELSNGRIYA
jgi:hypothetical protein